MKSICELSVMDCFYHNVAKYYEKDAEKFANFISLRDKHFWIEYSGTVRLGIDASLLKIDVDGSTVTITIPPAKILSCTVDESTLKEDSYIVAKNSAKVTAEDEIEAFKQAQARLQASAENDTTLLQEAQQRAQMLLEDYIQNIGNVSDKVYDIQWVYLNSGSEQATPVPPTPTAEPEA